MDSWDIQAQCEAGQRQLMEMDYLGAEKTLEAAERAAWGAKDFDVLARLYMPLQEARRQRRQRCGEGIVRLDLVARGAENRLDAGEIVRENPQGQLLVAGWGSIEPAMEVRRIQAERGLFVETFLAAVYPAGAGRVVVIVPRGGVQLPGAEPRSVEALMARLPAQSIVLGAGELPQGKMRGTAETYGRVMEMWERLHGPFLAMAESEKDAIGRIEGYRRTIDVDYACELAHQKLADTARKLGQKLV